VTGNSSALRFRGRARASGYQQKYTYETRCYRRLHKSGDARTSPKYAERRVLVQTRQKMWLAFGKSSGCVRQLTQPSKISRATSGFQHLGHCSRHPLRALTLTWTLTDDLERDKESAQALYDLMFNRSQLPRGHRAYVSGPSFRTPRKVIQSLRLTLMPHLGNGDQDGSKRIEDSRHLFAAL